MLDPPSTSNEVITLVLSLIDISLIASLVLMVMLACYENFVSGFELGGYKYKPSWMGHIDFGELKVKRLTSMVAISAMSGISPMPPIAGVGGMAMPFVSL